MLLGALPALASAATFEVNTTTDTETMLAPCEEGHQCTLRDAIHLADAPGSGPNSINFAGIPAESVIQVDEAQLPQIDEEVTIDGFITEAGTSATPAVELAPINMPEESFPVGLTVIGTEGARIEGLAFGGWGAGIEIEPNEAESAVETEVCGNYLGVKMGGAETFPNEIGIEIRSGAIGEDSEGTLIGSPADGCAGNVISGNEFFGIEDAGFQTTIAGNRIGIGPESTEGIPMPNGTPGEGSAGVLERPSANGTMIGGTTPGAGEANLIYFNRGAGVKVESAAGEVAIRGNSISENEGLGIELSGGGSASPELEKAELTSTNELLVEGSVEASGAETVELEFFGNAACEAGGLGQGQTILGTHSLAVVPGANTYSFTLPVNPPVAETGFTATSTRAEGIGATSEFSPCLTENFERTFTVNTLADTNNSGGECTATCSLRDALTLANLSEAADTIDFAVAGTIAVEPEPLPTINHPVVIDGTTAPGYGGTPLVLLDGTDAFTEGETEGLVVEPEAGGSVIKGLAIGGFDYGVYLTGATGSQLCSSWIGVELDGTTALPNEYGVETGSDSTGNRIGAGCGSEGGDLISANREWGIRDFGLDTTVAASRVGVDIAGAPLPNGTNHDGGGGILEWETSSGASIGGGGNPPNVIADNIGPGVAVQTAVSRVAIRGNSIFGNERPGIEIGEGGTEAPTIESVAVGSGTVALTGEATAGDGPETIELDFFAGEACGPGEGRTYLGSATVANTTGGAASYATGPIAATIPTGQDFITVTATGSELGQTSEFSACFLFVPPPRSFTVNSLGDGETAAGCEAETVCTLRGAIEAANDTEALDTIEFGVTGLIEPLTELPQITEGVDIDATTVPGYAGSPLFEIGGSEQLNNDGGTEGLVIAASAEGTTIKGLTVTRFDNGIIVDGNGTLLEADTVAHNGDIGVSVNGTAPQTAVRRSEIFANATGELRFETPNGVTEPELESFVAGSTSTSLRVPIKEALPDHEYAIDVYANAHCEKPGEHGPMEVFLGSGDVTTDAGGNGRAEFTGVPLGGIDAEAFTVTATDLETGTTGGIGHCTYPPIDTAIETKPPALSASREATFTFVGETVGHVEGFECSLDAAAFASCTSPEELTGLSDGTHTFKVRAFNGEGIRDFTPAVYEWTVDTEAPEITITAAPPAKTNSGNATFAFAVSDPSSDVTAVECSLDGAAFADCESPKEYGGLVAGTHTFAVQAEDAAGNVNTVSREWKIVTEAPSPTITAAPPATTETTTATFAFGGAPGSEVSGYECSLDGSAYAACASPQSFSGLAPGAHAFSVRSNDEAGNTSAPTVYQWTVAAAQVTPPGPQPNNSSPEPSDTGPAPTNGEKVIVAPVEGKVRIKLPGSKKYVSLQELKEIPVGAVIDATKGRVKLTSRNPDGTEQTAEFFEGVFRVKQRTGAGLVVLELLDTRACPAPGATGRAIASSLALRPTGAGTAGKLWGSGHGNFRTEGNDGSATVRGTIWLVEDRCDGTTFFKTRRDVVTVKDFITKKTFSLREGRSYLAGG
jgi:CSLREA domain-containing protein